MAADRTRGRRSVLAFVSADGFVWRWTSVVAAAAQLPGVAEGPSENALATLRNGSVLCVMRVEGQSGHHSPYRSAVSDDGGESWHSLRALPAGERPRNVYDYFAKNAMVLEREQPLQGCACSARHEMARAMPTQGRGHGRRRATMPGDSSR